MINNVFHIIKGGYTLNIGIFTDTYTPQVNGVVTSVKTLKKELENKGHKVTIVTVKNKKSQSKKDVIRTPAVSFPLIPEHRVGIYSYRFIKKIRNLNLDLIHTQTEFSVGILGRIMAKLFDIPVVHTYHTMYEDYTHYITKGKMDSFASGLAKKLSKIYCKNCDRIIAPTEKTKNALLSYGLKREIDIVPTGINIKQFLNCDSSKIDKNDLKQELGIEPNAPVVLYIGRLAREKSIDVVINQMVSLLDEIPKAKLLIVGDGPERDNLEKLSNKLNINESVVFAGEKPWSEIQKYYRLGDVFVSASTTETQGLTYIEAMASKLPIVARYDSNLEGVIEENINGYLFNNNKDLSEILKKLLKNEIKLRKMGEKSLDKSRDYSAQNFAYKVERVYLKAIFNNKLLSRTG